VIPREVRGVANRKSDQLEWKQYEEERGEWTARRTGDEIEIKEERAGEKKSLVDSSAERLESDDEREKGGIV
jgi:hypothetical protein